MTPSSSLKDALIEKLNARRIRSMDEELAARHPGEDFTGFSALFQQGRAKPRGKKVDPVADLSARMEAQRSKRDDEMRARLSKKTGIGTPPGRPVFTGDMLDMLRIPHPDHSWAGLNPDGMDQEERQWVQDQADAMNSEPYVSPYRGAKPGK